MTDSEMRLTFRLAPQVAGPEETQLHCITVTPSIQNATHGKKKICGHHCSIIDGEVTP